MIVKHVDRVLREEMFSGMFDKDHNSTIDLNEFKALWNFIIEWEKVFRGFDEDRSGAIDKSEFRKALASSGNQRRRMDEYLHMFILRSTICSLCLLLLFILGFGRARLSVSLFTFIGMFDQDGSSTIDFQEFRALWRYVTEWEKCFRFVCF